MSILTLSEAASFLKIGAKSLEKMARQNQIPARKVAREWRFNQDSLVKWLEADYLNPALQAVGKTHEEIKPICQSNNAVKRKSGGSTSTPQTAKEYAKVVALLIKNKRRNTTTS